MARTHHHHDFKGLSDWVEIFRAGSHIDSAGRACAFTTADLDQIVANTTSAPAPAVLGHPKHDDPAYAWTRGLKRDGDTLFAQFTDVNPDFEAGIASGAYRNRSVSIYKDPAAGWKLRHVGWLGAAPPAITGLKPVEFAAADGVEVHEFADQDDLQIAWALDDIAQMFRRLRDWVISDKGLETADRVLPDYHVTSIAGYAQQVRQAALDEINSTTTEETPPMSFTQADLDRVQAETAARVKAETEAQFSAQQAELVRLQSERTRERISTQVNGWTAKGLVTPAEAPGLVEFMAQVDASGEFQFAAADGQTEKKTPAVWFAEFMASRKPVVKLGERRDDGEGPIVNMADAASIVAAATAYQFEQQKLGITVSVEAAVQHVKDLSQQGA